MHSPTDAQSNSPAGQRSQIDLLLLLLEVLALADILVLVDLHVGPTGLDACVLRVFSERNGHFCAVCEPLDDEILDVVEGVHFEHEALRE